MTNSKKRKTVDRIRDAGTGLFLSDKQAKGMPKDKIVKERVPKPGNSIGN